MFTIDILLPSECIDGITIIIPEHYMREMSGSAKTDPSGSLNSMTTYDISKNTAVNGKFVTDHIKTLSDDVEIHKSTL